MLPRLINKFHVLRDRYLLRLPARAPNPYFTHVPILLAAGRWWRIRRVLEFGCGEFSTKLFLDSRRFPDLQQLESYENDPVWAERIRQHFGVDPRLNLHLVDGAVAKQVEGLDLEGFDLILIDDSTSGRERCDTIRAVAAAQPQRAIVIIHDFEYLPYREAASSFRHRYRFTGMNPNIGMVWNGASVRRQSLRVLNRTLRQNVHKLEFDEWSSILAQFSRVSACTFERTSKL